MTSYCRKCGAYIPQAAKKCLACGAGEETQDDLVFPPPVKYGAPAKRAPPKPQRIQKRLNHEYVEPEEIPTYPLDSDVIGSTSVGRDISGRIYRSPVASVDGNTKEARKRWVDKDRPVDLDLDKARNSYINVRINGKVSRFYCTKADMMCRYVAGDDEKRVFYLQIVEA